MQIIDDKLFLSPTDLNKYLSCNHLINLEIRRLRGETFPEQESEITMSDLVAQKGKKHERKYLEYLREQNFNIAEIPSNEISVTEKISLTNEAISNNIDIIFQAFLKGSRWIGIADFLVKDDLNNSYEVSDTKLKKTLAAEYISQVVIYSNLLREQTGVVSNFGSIISPSHNEETNFTKHQFLINDYKMYVDHQMTTLEKFVEEEQETRPLPCSHCERCDFKFICRQEWIESRSIFELPNATKLQEKRLAESNIFNIYDLINATQKPVKMGLATFNKLKSRAKLRGPRLDGGEANFEVLGDEGLKFMPKQDPHDIYFDIEGDPLIEGGLEYLFGVLVKENQGTTFKDNWAHTKLEEKNKTQELINFFYQHCLKFPNAHIYHYNAYEVNALRKLSQLHAVGEVQLDSLLRAERFVDIYTIVQKTLITSEKGISLKDLEIFYNFQREEEITDAGSSVVMYEKWLELRNPQILEEIKLYNEQDCRSLMYMRDWLDNIIPNFSLFRITLDLNIDIEIEDAQFENETFNIAKAIEKFHEREKKPFWWSYFDAKTRDVEDLILDSSILSGLVRHQNEDTTLFSFPDQDHKFSKGDSVSVIEPSVAETNFRLNGKIEKIDDLNNLLELSGRIGTSSLIHIKEPIPPFTKSIEDILENFFYYVSTNKAEKFYPAAFGLIFNSNDAEEFPNVVSERIIDHPNLNKSNLPLFIQGPPGSGKTYQGALFLKNLIENKVPKICFITAQSHKAIENVLNLFLKESPQHEDNVLKFGGKKTSNLPHVSQYKNLHQIIQMSKEKSSFLFVGLTVFAITKLSEFFETKLSKIADYLIIDEAGQYGLANAVASAYFCENIILLGDQNQLPNVTQGSHPLNVGLSVMEFCLGSNTIVTENQGIFLSTTRRLHPKICNYISECFYQSRLMPHENNNLKKITIDEDGIIKDLSGINLIELNHEGCTQSSIEEQEYILHKINNLVEDGKITDEQISRTISYEDIIVVAPYNNQVNGLIDKLPNDVRIGTVDKFQGQEAPICIISMTSSSINDAPRGIDFLLSSNRLNVAISRAQISVFIFVSKYIFSAEAKSKEQMKLLNDFCKLRKFCN